MSREDLEKFKKMILKSSTLQESLKEALDQEEFIELAVRLGQENSYNFTAEELEEFLEDQNQLLVNRTYGERTIDRIKISSFPPPLRRPLAYWQPPI